MSGCDGRAGDVEGPSMALIPISPGQAAGNNNDHNYHRNTAIFSARTTVKFSESFAYSFCRLLTLEFQVQERRNHLPCLPWYSQHPALSVAHTWCSINICWMHERMNEWPIITNAWEDLTAYKTHSHGLQLVIAALQVKLNVLKWQRILTALCVDWALLCGPHAVRSPRDSTGLPP